MTKHKKFIKSEKAKIKLNLKGAKLPKGLNVTKTEFKVKKILIRTQLADTFNADGTVIRPQNVRDLLAKLQHHNATIRNEGLRYLKEQLATYPAECRPHFGAICLGLAQLGLDAERDVRKEGSRALGILLSTSSAEAVRPFFDTLSSYLRCSMTHIQQPVQEDSLLMLDQLLLHVPSLVASSASSDRIFQSFLDMISKLRVESRPGRTLSVNLGSKMTSVRWRSQVLDRLLRMLRAMVEEKRTAQTVAAAIPQHKFLVGKENHFSIAATRPLRNCSVPGLFRRSRAAATAAASSTAASNQNAAATPTTAAAAPSSAAAVSFDDEGRRVRHYVEQLMPLMLETWMEVRPANFGTDYNQDLVLSMEAAHSLQTILEIVERLLELVAAWDKQENNTDMGEWFARTYARDFGAQLFVGFPYVQGEGYRGSKKKAKGVPTEAEVQAAGGSKCYAQNLSLAYVFASMHGSPIATETVDAQRVVTYLTTVVPLLHSAPADVQTALLRTLRAVLVHNGSQWTRAKLSTRKLLAIALDTYQRQRFAKEVRTRVLMLLCDVVLDVQLCRQYGDDLFTEWLVTLPRLLCQPFVSQHVLRTFTTLGAQVNRLFLKHLEEAVPDIIANLSAIQVTGTDDQLEAKRHIASLLFWLPNHKGWLDQSGAQLAAQDEAVRDFVLDIVRMK